MNVQWIFQRVKMLIKGAIVAMIIAVPCFNVHAQAPMNKVQPNYPQYFQMHHQDQRKAPMNIAVDTGTPRFLVDGAVNPNFRQTVYDVVREGGKQVSHGEYWNSKNMRVHNNVIQYHDKEYGWIQVVALNIDQVKEYGSVVTSTMLGSVIEMKYPNGQTTRAIVMDVCGAARYERKVDLWVYDLQKAKGNTNTGDISGVEFKFIRFGF